MKLARALTLAYAFLSAALYCSLMPLWEGFDELYHYGYVQHVATTGSIPAVGKTTLSRELWTSIDFLPVSHYIQPYLERPSTSFEQYFALTAQQRWTLRRGADWIDPASRHQSSPRANYEAMQAPLTYFLLAPVDALLWRIPLMTRVLVLRLLLSFLTVALLGTGARRLARRLGLQGPVEIAALFVVFSCQMFYAATCRIGNDALAAPWLLFFLVAVIDAVASPTLRRIAWVAIVMALGLLIKSSLLVFVPLACIPLVKAPKHAPVFAAILAAVAAPWYLRNVVLYHNLTGTVESTTGVGPAELLHAARALPWARSIVSTAHSALWTGNNSFTTFSEWTLNAVLALLVAGIVLYGVRARRTAPELITIAAIVLYGLGLIVIALTFFHSSHGQIIAPMPWYAPVLLAPLVSLAFLRPNRWIAAATVLLCAYVAAVSWVAKLLPLYGGFDQRHARPKELLTWYFASGAQRDSVLSNLCPAPAPVVYVLLAAVVGTLLFLSVRLVCLMHADEGVGGRPGGPPHVAS